MAATIQVSFDGRRKLPLEIIEMIAGYRFRNDEQPLFHT